VLKLTRVVFQLDVLEQDAFDILRLVRSWKNRIAPINRIPPEILALVPNFWSVEDRDENLITLTHVCRAWRDLFVMRPTLWTDIDCVDEDKTRAYLERSKSSPINLSLASDKVDLSDPFFEFIPDITGRLKSLEIDLYPDDLQLISVHLSRRAPLLEVLAVRSGDDPVLPSVLFNGDLSSLRKLQLKYVRTELPWRNMVNLTSFTLRHDSPISVRQFLDFFEGAPHLHEVDILSPTPISDAQSGRLVSLACLQRMKAGLDPFSSLFDHLLIPVGAHLKMGVDLPSPPIEGRPPRFIKNLKNLSNFTVIKLISGDPHIYFSGPNGEVRMYTRTGWFFRSLAHFDTSKTRRFEIIQHSNPPTDGSVHRTLLPMDDLRTLTLYQCGGPHIFICALDPSMSSSGVVICSKLEELIIVQGGEFDIKIVVAMAAARAARGAKLGFVRIDPWGKTVYPQSDVLELKKHILHVECPIRVAAPRTGSSEEG